MARTVEINLETDGIGKGEEYCMWYACPKCQGQNIMEDYRHCPNCGVKLVMVGETPN